jgi:hypothetical protein
VSTASLADADGMGDLAFQWQRSTGGAFVDIDGATARKLGLTDSLRGKKVRVVVTFTDNGGHHERLVSRVLTVPRTRASAPEIVRTRSGVPGGRATAYVAWHRPALTGGSSITGYQVQALRLRKDGSVAHRTTVNLRAGARSVTMRLEPGRYRFKVRAENAMGIGKAAVSRVVGAR